MLTTVGSLVGQAGRRKAALLLVAAALALTGVFALTAQQAKATWYWGCTYSWGEACFSKHYEPMDFLETMGPQQACKKFGCEVKPLNGYKDPTEDGRVRCVGSAIWNGREQIVPWVAGWGDLYATYAHPGFYGAGMIGTCAEYYQIALYQFDEYY